MYGFEAVNVEAQSREPSSLLNWTKRLLTVRSSTQAFGRGRFTMLQPGNRKVLAYLREFQDEVILCVANVSRVAQPVELELGAWQTRVPVEMIGRTSFPPIGELPYLLTLPAYGFFWFRLSIDATPPLWHTDRLPVEDLPVLVLFDGWNSFFRNRVVPWRIGMADKTRTEIETTTLPRFMQRQRWYAAKGEKVSRVAIAENFVLKSGRDEWLLALMEPQGLADSSRYFVPLAMVFEEQEEERAKALAALAVTRVRQQATTGVLADAMADEPFCRALVEAIGAGRTLEGDGGVSLHFTPAAAYREVVGDALRQHGPLPLQRLTASSNSISLLGDRLFLKAYRRLQAGVNPELEMGRYLTDVVGFKHCVAVAGSIDMHTSDGTVWSLAMLQQQVDNQGDAWAYTVGQVQLLLESQGKVGEVEASADSGIGVAERMQVLAQRIAELHVALGRKTGDAAFDPEPVESADVKRWAEAVEADCRNTLAQLEQRSKGWAEPLVSLAAQVVAAAPALLARIAAVAQAAPAGTKSRLHGDLHLGQVLVTGGDFLIIDFEGEPQRSLAERRAKHSALRDVAGMLRSFDYARHTALHQAAQSPVEFERLAPVARAWERRVRRMFLDTYRDIAVAGQLYPDAAAFDAAVPLLDLFELEKALYELRYEMDNRPDWVAVPLAGIVELMAAHDAD